MLTLALITGLALGFTAGWLLKPAGDHVRGRCGVPLGGGRHCRGRLRAGSRWCWRHPEGRVVAPAAGAATEPPPPAIVEDFEAQGVADASH